MANVFQARGPGIRPKGTGNAFQGLVPLGQAIGAGLQQQFARQQQGQQLLVQLFQTDPEVAAATVRGMGVRGLVQMGLPPQQANDLFAQAQGTVEERPAAGGVGMESVEQPGMLRPRTAMEQAQIQQAQAGVGETQARTGLFGAQEEQARFQTREELPAEVERVKAEAELMRAKMPQVEAYTSLIWNQGNTEQVRTQLADMDLALKRQERDRGRIENKAKREAFISTFVDRRSLEPLSDQQRRVMRRVLEKDEPLPSWAHPLTPGQAEVLSMAQQIGVPFKDMQELNKYAFDLDMDRKLYETLTMEYGPDKERAYIDYLDDVMRKAAESQDKVPALTPEQQRMLTKDYAPLYEEWIGSFVSTNPNKPTLLKAKYLSDDISLDESQELYQLMLFGDPSVNAVRKDLSEFIAANGEERASRPGILERIRLEAWNIDGVKKSLRGEEVINAIANARQKGQQVLLLGQQLAKADPENMTVTPDGKLVYIPPGGETPEVTSQDERMKMFQEQFLGGIDQRIEDIQSRLEQLGD